MKHVIIIAIFFVTTVTSAQTNFEKGMQKAFNLWEANNWTEAEQMFERIASAEPNEWLPNYYIAQMNSLKTWEEKDPQKVKAQLDKAQEYLNTAMGLSKDNADIFVMQAQIYTNWVAFDGMTYGMKYSAKVTELYNKAYKLSPDNPMVVLGRADWNIGSAKYFGQDIKPFCKDVEKAIELFANFKPESPFHPNWGKERAAEVLASCK
jgi:tetratricopeptide (TPR) repeat protein